MALAPATDRELEQILDETYPLWGEGLSRRAYGAWNRAQMHTPWGRAHLRRVVLTESGVVLSSAKAYEFGAWVAGERRPVLGIGAVFTPPAHRGHGYARQLISDMLAEAARRGRAAALLFSEIGAAYYEALGFRAIERPRFTLRVRRGTGAPATFVRAGEPADLPGLAELSSSYATGAGFALDRSADLVAFALARKRLLAGLGPAGLREVEFFVAEEGHQPVAYVVLTRGPEGMILQECGDRDPSGARIGAILQGLLARTPAEPAPRVHGWLPPGLRPPQVLVDDEAPAPDVMMWRPLADSTRSVKDLHDPVYWQADVF